MTHDSKTLQTIAGRTMWRGDADYEATRQQAVWNARKPGRYPDVIVVATAEQDVISAVRYARSRGMKVAVRNGGHNMSAPQLRDGGMLIDLSQMNAISVDAETRSAVVEPGVTAAALARALGEHGLGFPVAHHPTVALGGYLIAGGLGWNMGAWGGPACFSVAGVEMVTADGEKMVADDDTNRELFWAVRGAGPGFFAVATRFHLRAYPLPRAIMSSLYVYPLAEVEEIGAWASSIAPELPSAVEMLVHVLSAPPGAPAGPAGKAVAVAASVFADSQAEAIDALVPLDTCPALGRALVRSVGEQSSFDALFAALQQRFPERHRYLENSWWSDRDYSGVLPVLAEHLVGAPSAKSFAMTAMLPSPPAGAQSPDAAFSMAGRSFSLAYAIWEDEGQDAANESWQRQLAGALDPTSVGHYIAEADLMSEPSRAGRSFAPANWRKLQTLRLKYDPEGVFYSYLGQ